MLIILQIRKKHKIGTKLALTELSRFKGIFDKLKDTIMNDLSMRRVQERLE